ncbi:hypothetical protein J6N69_06590 [bacterium]|nr:hypothetical protein [bacterium]
MNTINNKGLSLEKICEKISEQRDYLFKTIGLLKVLHDALLYALDNNSDEYYYYTCSEILLNKFLDINDKFEDIETNLFAIKNRL